MSSPTTGLLTQKHLIVVTTSELLRRAILIWVILVSVVAPDIVLVVHVFCILLGLVVCTLAVPFIHAWYRISILNSEFLSMTLRTLGLNDLVNLTANDSDEELLREGVVDSLAFCLSAETSYGHGVG